MIRTIKIFIASSSELQSDREAFRMFISLENERLIQQDIFLQIVQWEHFIDAISNTRMQDEYNKSIREADIVLCLFFTKVGKYTAEEFDVAYTAFKETGKPAIWTYFKDAPIDTRSITDEIATLLSFKQKLNAMGHFYTSYTNSDNLKYQFRSQLDKFLPALTMQTGSATDLAEKNNILKAGELTKNTFNEKLTKKLIEAIQPYSPRAKKFFENASRMAANWEMQPRFSDTAKEIIAFSYAGILGIQLRKLMAIGKEDMSAIKLKKYLENCRLTCKRALQLLCFAFVSKLWDVRKNNNYMLSADQQTACKNFFDDEFEPEIDSLIVLLKTLTEIFVENALDFPVAELKGFDAKLTAENNFVIACNQLKDIDILLNASSFTLEDCINAENNLATILEALSFFANYKMVSIKSIGYFEMRNSQPHYLYNYTALGVDIKSNINQEKVNYAEAPINTDAVLLYKRNYQESLNLFPFIIDVNALAYEGGAKICFYACRNNADGSLNYNFLEDNSIVNIANTETLRPGTDMNEIFMDVKKRKDIKFDAVYTLFEEAKKTVTGIEEDDMEDTF